MTNRMDYSRIDSIFGYAVVTNVNIEEQDNLNKKHGVSDYLHLMDNYAFSGLNMFAAGLNSTFDIEQSAEYIPAPFTFQNRKQSDNSRHPVKPINLSKKRIMNTMKSNHCTTAQAIEHILSDYIDYISMVPYDSDIARMPYITIPRSMATPPMITVDVDNDDITGTLMKLKRYDVPMPSIILVNPVTGHHQLDWMLTESYPHLGTAYMDDSITGGVKPVPGLNDVSMNTMYSEVIHSLTYLLDGDVLFTDERRRNPLCAFDTIKLVPSGNVIMDDHTTRVRVPARNDNGSLQWKTDYDHQSYMKYTSDYIDVRMAVIKPIECYDLEELHASIARNKDVRLVTDKMLFSHYNLKKAALHRNNELLRTGSYQGGYAGSADNAPRFGSIRSIVDYIYSEYGSVDARTGEYIIREGHRNNAVFECSRMMYMNGFDAKHFIKRSLNIENLDRNGLGGYGSGHKKSHNYSSSELMKTVQSTADWLESNGLMPDLITSFSELDDIDRADLADNNENAITGRNVNSNAAFRLWVKDVSRNGRHRVNLVRKNKDDSSYGYGKVYTTDGAYHDAVVELGRKGGSRNSELQIATRARNLVRSIETRAYNAIRKRDSLILHLGKIGDDVLREFESRRVLKPKQHKGDADIVIRIPRYSKIESMGCSLDNGRLAMVSGFSKNTAYVNYCNINRMMRAFMSVVPVVHIASMNLHGVVKPADCTDLYDFVGRDRRLFNACLLAACIRSGMMLVLAEARLSLKPYAADETRNIRWFSDLKGAFMPASSADRPEVLVERGFVAVFGGLVEPSSDDCSIAGNVSRNAVVADIVGNTSGSVDVDEDDLTGEGSGSYRTGVLLIDGMNDAFAGLPNVIDDEFGSYCRSYYIGMRTLYAGNDKAIMFLDTIERALVDSDYNVDNPLDDLVMVHLLDGYGAASRLSYASDDYINIFNSWRPNYMTPSEYNAGIGRFIRLCNEAGQYFIDNKKATHREDKKYLTVADRKWLDENWDTYANGSSDYNYKRLRKNGFKPVD